MILKGVKTEIDVKVTAEVLQDNGRILKVPFMVTFKKPSRSENEALIEREKTYDEDTRYTRFKAAALKEHVLGWSGVPTATGEEFEFTEENLDAMLEITEYLNALWVSFTAVATGRGALKGN
jgi:hypothetical protein